MLNYFESELFYHDEPFKKNVSQFSILRKYYLSMTADFSLLTAHIFVKFQSAGDTLQLYRLPQCVRMREGRQDEPSGPMSGLVACM